MEKLLRPELFDIEPNSANCNKEWSHWQIKLEKCIKRVRDITDEDKLDLLVTYVSATVYSYIEDCTTYAAAIETLNKIYNPKKNEIFARHELRSCKQEEGQSIDSYFQKLKGLARDCDFKAVDKATHENEAIRDTFIQGISSANIRQRLLESDKTDVVSVYELARSLEVAKNQADTYRASSSSSNAITQQPIPPETKPIETLAATDNWQCYFCGEKEYHRRNVCPANDEWCGKCGRKGHRKAVCRSSNNNNSRSNKRKGNKDQLSSIHYLAASPPSLSKSTHTVIVNGKQLDGLTDTGSSGCFLDYDVVRKNNWVIDTSDTSSSISLASSSHVSKPVGECKVDLIFSNKHFHNRSFTIVKNLCADVIIGLDILGEFSSVTLELGGEKDPLTVCSMHAIPPASLFGNLDPSIQPIRVKSKRYSTEDKVFINNEITNLRDRNKIEESHSPWRAQVLVHRGDANHRDRFIIDYSRTINRYTSLDAYPVPRIDEMVEELSQHKYFTTLDLSSAFHQVPIPEHERPFTAFEACGRLWQFTCIPFGVTNGVSAFQRTMDTITSKEQLKATFIYVDNITIAGKSKEEHDDNVSAFMAAAARYNLEFNDCKTVSCVESISILGYMVSHGKIQPDPDRVSPLIDLPLPYDDKSLHSALGLFAHHSKWIKNFSEKIYPLSHADSYPLNDSAQSAFSLLKQDIADSVLATPDLSKPFIIETDASEYAIGATLSQSDRPVAFFSRSLNSSEKKHHSVEKEAYAIVESIRKWRHYLLGSHFTVITDQKSVSFMFDKSNHGKIKNDKIARWRIELSSYEFDIIHRPGKLNVSADALSRAPAEEKVCSAIVDLKKLHDQLCHPGVSRLNHFVKMKNLPYSVEDVKKVASDCPDCAIVKPRFYKPKVPQHLIKALAPMERLNIDFKGPLPSNSKNKFLLTLVDEYSRYSFAFPCVNTSTESVKRCLLSVFSIFGMPSYIHNDNGSSLISAELKAFLLERGIATSRSTRYNPQGNGQVEKYNGTIWKAVQLALRTQNLPITQWENVLTDALHSVRSLLCTATNETPHDRMFRFPRKSTYGSSLPSWLIHDDKALMKRHVRRSKYEPLVEEVEILDVNPQTSHVRTLNGHEMTVSNRHLAPIGDSSHAYSDTVDSNPSQVPLIESGDLSAHQSDTASLPPADTHCTDQIDFVVNRNDDETVESSADSDSIEFSDEERSHYVRRSERPTKQTIFYGINNQ